MIDVYAYHMYCIEGTISKVQDEVYCEQCFLRAIYLNRYGHFTVNIERYHRTVIRDNEITYDIMVEENFQCALCQTFLLTYTKIHRSEYGPCTECDDIKSNINHILTIENHDAQCICEVCITVLDC